MPPSPSPSPVTATRRHARSALRRRQVLDAALACFADKGVEATAIEDICAASGASVGSIYHQFDSKTDVAAAVYLDAMADYQAAVTRSLEAVPDAREGILAIVSAHVRWAEDNPVRARFLQQARHTEVVASHGESIAELNRSFGRRVAEWMAPHMQAGRLRPMMVDIFIAQLLGPAQEYLRGRLTGRGTTGPDAAIRALGEAAWRALGKDGPREASRTPGLMQ